MKRGKKVSRYRGRVRDTARMAWYKSQVCAVAMDPAMGELAGPCEGVTEADHVRDMSGMGRKPEDTALCPLCTRHHRLPGLEALCFGKTEKGYAKQWKLEQAEAYHLAYEAQMGTAEAEEGE